MENAELTPDAEVVTPAPEADPADATPERPLSTQDAMRKALSDIKEREEQSEKKIERSRDEGGRFKAGEDKPEVKVDAPEVKATEPVATVAGTEKPPEPYELPKSWGKDYQEAWGKLPRDLQAQVTKREGERDLEVRRAHASRDQAAAAVQSIAKVLEPHKSLMDALGTKPNDVIAAVLSDARVAYTGSREEKIGLVGRILQTTGLSLQDLTGDQESSNTSQVRGSSAELASANARLAEMQAQLDEMRRQADQRVASIQDNWSNELIRAVAFETDSAGNPVRPHFDRLQSHIAALTTSLVAQGNDARTALVSAYDLAVAADPQAAEEKRSLQQRVWEEEVRKKAEQERLERAKALSAPGGSGVAQSNGGLRQFKSTRDAVKFYLEHPEERRT